MGEYGTTDNIHNDASLNQVFSGFKEHCNFPRASTELTVIELLRKAHPESHVTGINPQKCDLFGYATAGHAMATMDSDESYDATRSYKAPRSRLEKKAGILKDHVRFGRWRYTWRESEYTIYEIEYYDYRVPIKMHFVLSPRTKGAGAEQHNARTDELLVAVGAWSSKLHDEIFVFDDGHWVKNNELWQSVQGCSWDEIILNRDMKDNLIEDVLGFFNNQELYKKLAVPWKRGLILHGAPGNGKTISIKALISALSARPDPIPSLYVKSFDSCEGSKCSIRTIFTKARDIAPCLLIFEDLDSLVEDETRSYFLNEVDGLESNDGILMIGSTNHLDSLDPAISKRPSRFDRKYHFKIPSEEERIAYCQFWKRKLEDSEQVDFVEEMCSIVAKITEGFSFAYLKELFVITLLTIVRGGVTEEEEEEEEEEEVITAKEDNPWRTKSASVDKTVLISTENTAETPIKESTPTPASAQENKRVMPEVDIPASLKKNLLLKVIRRQTQMLLDEMDNTKEDLLSSEKSK